MARDKNEEEVICFLCLCRNKCHYFFLGGTAKPKDPVACAWQPLARPRDKTRGVWGTQVFIVDHVLAERLKKFLECAVPL